MPTNHNRNDGLEVYEVKGPKPNTEKVVPYYEYAPTIFKKKIGVSPSRFTISGYANKKTGFPVKKGGPYVKVPVFKVLKRVYTTQEAMDRFFKKVIKLEGDLGICDASKY